MSKSTVKTAIIALISLLTAGLVFGLVSYQVLSQGEELTGHIETLEKQAAQEASFNRLIDISERTADDRELVASSFLEKESSSIDFLNQVETLAPQLGVSLSTKELDTIQDDGSDEYWIATSFVVYASKEKVVDFVKILENMPYVIRVTKLEMSPKSTEFWEAQISLQVKILDHGE